ncbi:MAG: MOSC domain-containing protein [Chromatocurvus sp.]
MTGGMVLSGLFIYPVKSCAGIALTSATLDRFGLAGDRRWLLVDARNRFLSQRSLPAMGQVAVVERVDGLTLCYQRHELTVQTPGADAARRCVEVWGDYVEALDAGDAAAVWLSSMLGRPCRLVYMGDDAERPVDADYAVHGETVSFADGFPLLLSAEASLASINEALDAPVSMRRFRPNLVISGSTPFAEDGWHRLMIGECTFTVAKPCSRCVIPTLDPDTGAVHPDLNRVLAATRRIDGVILFGLNLLHDGSGGLQLGDALQVLD